MNLKSLAATLTVLCSLVMVPLSTHAQVPSRLATPVRIVNTPLPTEIAPQQPFQFGMINVEFDPTQLGAHVSFTVPAGKRLVIEYVSGDILQDIGDAVSFAVTTTVNGVTAAHRMVLTPVGPAGGFAKAFTAAKSLRVYADPGTEVTISALNTLGGRLRCMRLSRVI